VTGVMTRIILKIVLNEQVGGYGFDLSDAEEGSVLGCSQSGKETSLSIKCGEFS
jgi:hypothetical protein